MGFLRVRNWERYQKISGNKAPYVQVQTDILLDMDFMGLPDRERLCFLLLLCLAGRTQNRLPGDMSQIMHLCHFDDVPNVPLMMAHGLIEEWSEEKHTESVVKEEDRKRYERERKKEWRDSKACPENVPAMSRLERERERETDKETDKEQAAQKRAPRKTRLNVPELPDDWRDYLKTKRPDLDPAITFTRFSEYYLSHGRLMADWKLTWQRWVREEKRNGNTNRAGSSAVSRGREASDRARAEIARQAFGDAAVLGPDDRDIRAAMGG